MDAVAIIWYFSAANKKSLFSTKYKTCSKASAYIYFIPFLLKTKQNSCSNN